MAIRKFMILSLLAAGTISVLSSSAVAQTSVPVPAPLSSGVSDGMILDSSGIELGPGETIISGPPGLQAYGSNLGQSGAMGMSGAPFQTLEPSAAMACSNGCYMPCEPGYYGIGEALYMKRSGGGFTRSSDFALDDFDWELGGRFTLGRRFDCVDGYEFVYAGLPEWEETNGVTLGPLPLNPVVPLSSQFVPGPGLLNDAFLAFNPYAAGQLAEDPALFSVPFAAGQRRRAQFHSIEFNRTYTGWDVIRCMMGLRTIIYNEDYSYISQSARNNDPNDIQTGLLTQSTDNLLIGPQLGLEMYYPLSRRAFINSRLKGGIYLDIVDSETRLFSGTPGVTRAIAGGDASDEAICGMFESSSQIGMHITPALSVFAGYDIWYMAGVATIEDQLPLVFGRLQGSSVEADSDVFIHGITLGARFEY